MKLSIVMQKKQRGRCSWWQALLTTVLTIVMVGSFGLNSLRTQPAQADEMTWPLPNPVEGLKWVGGGLLEGAREAQRGLQGFDPFGEMPLQARSGINSLPTQAGGMRIPGFDLGAAPGSPLHTGNPNPSTGISSQIPGFDVGGPRMSGLETFPASSGLPPYLSTPPFGGDTILEFPPFVCIEKVPDFNEYGPGSVFAGAYNPSTGSLLIAPFNNNRGTTLKKDGSKPAWNVDAHGELQRLLKPLEETKGVVGFTVILGEDGKAQIRWTSRSVNGWNYGNKVAPKGVRPPVIEALRTRAKLTDIVELE
jgi:hypothetical protein